MRGIERLIVNFKKTQIWSKIHQGLSFCTANSREPVESGYTPNFVTNQKTAFFVSANQRARKVPRERERGKLTL